MKSSWTDVLVLGAGVVGLTTAVCLAEARMSVRVRTHPDPRRMTSAAAGAILLPHLAYHPDLTTWCQQSHEEFESLAGQSASGVRLVPGVVAARTKTDECPHDWAKTFKGFRPCLRSELPEGFESGWTYTAPVIDMPVYLSYLIDRLADAGGKIDVDPVSSLDEVAAQASIAVNCTGFGARDLVPDDDLKPVRGDVIVVDNPGIERFFEATDPSPDPIYILPQGDRVVLGGTEVHGDANLQPDPAAAEAILDRCSAVEPLLKGLEIREHRVGVRPKRPEVRLEHVRLGQCDLIHNYGHGGAGVSLSWGCARAVLERITRIQKHT